MTGGVAAVIVAAGRGHRAGSEVPKQYRTIAGEAVIRPTLRAFLAHPQIDAVQPVIHPDDEGLFRAATAGLKDLLPPVAGRRDAAGFGARRARGASRRCARYRADP